MLELKINDSILRMGECLDVMRTIGSGSVDMVLCDLPYGSTQNKWDVVIPLAQLWQEYLRVAKPNTAFVFCAAQPFASLLVASNAADYRYEWIWEKGNATGFLNAKKHPLRAHESMQVFYRQQPPYNPQMSCGHQRKTSKRTAVNSECYGDANSSVVYDSTERYPRSVLFFSSDKQTASYHPTQKPVALMEYLIKTYSHRGHTVLDNTMGSGTTGVACMHTGRKFIGIERDPKYFAIACGRIIAALK